MAGDYLKIDVGYLGQQIDRLIAAYPELQEDEALRADVLEGETALNEVVSRVLDHALEAESMAEAIKVRMGFMSERMGRYTRRAEAMRGLILELMTKANLRSLPLPEATIAVSAGRDSVIITDLSSVPRQLGTTSWAPDKKAIGKQLAAGVEVPGVEIKTGPDTLRVSRK